MNFVRFTVALLGLNYIRASRLADRRQALLSRPRPILLLRRLCPAMPAILIASLPTLLLAQGQPPFNWAASSFQYDTGAQPSVAASGRNIIEVHQASAPGQVGALWSHKGQVPSIGTVKWAGASTNLQYDSGALPAVAMSGTTAIEVHQAQAAGNVGPLWYRTGKVSPSGTVKWAVNSFQYDSGAYPSVAVSGTTVIEVHQANGTTTGPLWYRMGQVQANGSVKWAASSFQYDSGSQPSVALDGSTLIEVHQANDPGVVGPLWYRTGEIQPDGTIAWASLSHQYDTGALPSIALSGPTFIEVHQADSGGTVGPLWYKTGSIQADGTATWAASALQYDNGAAPRIALTGSTMIEVHQADGTTVGPLWYHAGSF